MSLLSIIALVFGALGVWLTIKQNIWCWFFALVSVVASIIEFYNERLFGDMSLQVFYFFAGVYGWIYWKKQQSRERHYKHNVMLTKEASHDRDSSLAAQNDKQSFTVQKTPRAFIPVLLIATIAQSVLYYFLLLHFKGDKPLLDALLTACSLTATYMMTKKWVENWAAWVLIDGTYILLYGIKAMWSFALLYLLFTIMAYYGWQKWRKETA